MQRENCGPIPPGLRERILLESKKKKSSPSPDGGKRSGPPWEYKSSPSPDGGKRSGPPWEYGKSSNEKWSFLPCFILFSKIDNNRYLCMKLHPRVFCMWGWHFGAWRLCLDHYAWSWACTTLLTGYNMHAPLALYWVVEYCGLCMTIVVPSRACHEVPRNCNPFVTLDHNSMPTYHERITNIAKPPT